MSVLENLITDRTQADADRARALCAKGIGNMTADELLEFCSPMKGAYNYTDMNRVESAVSYLSTLLVQAPTDLRQYASDRGVAWDDIYDVPYDPSDYSSITVKTDWANGDTPTYAQRARYISNLKLIRSAIDSGSPTQIPDNMDQLTYSSANDIEQMLIDTGVALAALIENREGMIRSALAVYYSGEIYSGEGEA